MQTRCTKNGEDRSHLIHHAMEDVDTCIIRGRGKQRVLLVEGHRSQSVRMVAQRSVRLGGQIQIIPGKSLVLQYTDNHDDQASAAYQAG